MDVQKVCALSLVNLRSMVLPSTDEEDPQSLGDNASTTPNPGDD